ncbi:hypothetical protein K435DRAFT_860313 [Dendrothele bispora CBS 962.96]|uniref:Uncharacterized protein n=1 Tax=Dendrothele bispora (strain CBS 962.96) TaxID=1314807 RepID=A0A4S8LZG9_DENBC|nr:hypothetical protein K435DRAFT_860313 [Dendrothele bispora CBS 962.96]
MVFSKYHHRQKALMTSGKLAFTNRTPESLPSFSLQPPNGSDFSSPLNPHVGAFHEIYAESATPIHADYPASAQSYGVEASGNIFGPSIRTQPHVFKSSTSPTLAPYPSPSPSSTSSTGAGADHPDVAQSPDPNPPSSSSTTTKTTVATNSDYLHIPFTEIQKIHAPQNGTKTEQHHRKLVLDADPWVASFTKTSARCRGCGKTLQLEKRGTRYYYPANWIKHRDQGPCSQIKEGVFTEEKIYGS